MLEPGTGLGELVKPLICVVTRNFISTSVVEVKVPEINFDISLVIASGFSPWNKNLSGDGLAPVERINSISDKLLFRCCVQNPQQRFK